MRYADGGDLTAERRAAREGIRLEAGRRFARGDRNSVIARDHAAGYGRIVNTSSDALFGDTGLSASAVGKGAVSGLTTSSTAEGAAYGIKANAIVPIAATRTSLEAAGTTTDDRAAQRPVPRPARHRWWRCWPMRESASCTGELLHAASRRTARIFLGTTEGVVWTEALTPEMIRDGFPRIRLPTSERCAHRGASASLWTSPATRLGAGAAGPSALDLTTPAASA
ncbi:hypothetical protein GCM10010350_73750 [Streptomyces galilaeus]|nr:hypothetical protein GCM10010350_73750 [Streptomyces galilaeus]